MLRVIFENTLDIMNIILLNSLLENLLFCFTFTSKLTYNRFCVWSKAQVKYSFPMYTSNWKAPFIEKVAFPTALTASHRPLSIYGQVCSGPPTPSCSSVCQFLSTAIALKSVNIPFNKSFHLVDLFSKLSCLVLLLFISR